MAELSCSAVAANNRMHRARRLTGRGGYEWELGFDVVSFLEWRARTRGAAAWLDLCCGEGRALIDAADRFAAQGMVVDIHGVDLVGAFAACPPGLSRLSLRTGLLPGWVPSQRYAPGHLRPGAALRGRQAGLDHADGRLAVFGRSDDGAPRP